MVIKIYHENSLLLKINWSMYETWFEICDFRKSDFFIKLIISLLCGGEPRRMDEGKWSLVLLAKSFHAHFSQTWQKNYETQQNLSSQIWFSGWKYWLWFFWIIHDMSISNLARFPWRTSPTQLLLEVSSAVEENKAVKGNELEGDNSARLAQCTMHCKWVGRLF